MDPTVEPMRDLRGCDFDASAPEAFGDEYRLYADLRERCPMAWSGDLGGFWLPTRYEDVVRAANDPSRFIASVYNVIPDMAVGARRPPLGKDPPEHTPFRRALDRTLHKRRLERLADRLALHARRELGVLIERGEGDICREFGTVFPALVTTEWLNLPPEWTVDLREVALLFNVAWRNMDLERVNAAGVRLEAISHALLAERRDNPRPIEEDPVSSLLSERIDGEPISEELLIQTLRQVLVTGIIAPSPLVGSICVHLSQDRDLQEQLRADPSLIPAAFEEFLRLYVPYRGFARTSTEDVQVQGRTIRPRESVAMCYSAANRDPRVFSDPDEFQLHRSNIREHVGFGRGPHHCAGASLVRLYFKAILEELLGQTSSFSVIGDISGIEMARMPELGPLSLPMRFVAR